MDDYIHYHCRLHGGFWTDGAPVCPYCPVEEVEPDPKPTCDWCGDWLGDEVVTDIDGDKYHPHCNEERGSEDLQGLKNEG